MTRLQHPGHLEDWRKRLLEETTSIRRTIVVTAGTCRPGGRGPRNPRRPPGRDRPPGAGDKVGASRHRLPRLLRDGAERRRPARGTFYGRLKPADAEAVVKQTGPAARSSSG